MKEIYFPEISFEKAWVGKEDEKYVVKFQLGKVVGEIKAPQRRNLENMVRSIFSSFFSYVILEELKKL